jgi:hypothetical protein
MFELTEKEKTFMGKGGVIWCTRLRNAVWEVVKLSLKNEEVFDVKAPTVEIAHRWALLLADLADSSVPSMPHHSIRRY